MTTQQPFEFDSLMSEGVAASQLPHFLWGTILATRGDIEAAEAAFATAVLLAPEFSIARYQLGLLQFSAGPVALASLMTWRALLRRPDTDALRHFVEGFASLAQERFDEALMHFRWGVALNTEHPALSKDIYLVIARIKGRGYSAASDVVDLSEARALLANFRQQGTRR